MQVKTVQYGLGTKGHRSRMNGDWVSGPETLNAEQMGANRYDLGKTYFAHPLDDEFYAAMRPDWSKVKVPMLSAANWGGQPLHPRGNFEGFYRSASNKMARGARHRALDALLHRLWRWPAEEILRLFPERRAAMAGTNSRACNSISGTRTKSSLSATKKIGRSRDTQWTKFHLATEAQKLVDKAPNGSAKVTFDAMSDGVTFLTEPMKAETEITGPVAAKLHVSSSTSDADLFLAPRVFSPDMKEVVFQGALDPHTAIGQGWLRASHRKLDTKLTRPFRPYHTHEEKQPLKPGQVYELDIEIIPTCIVVPKGYRIALSIRGRDYVYPGGSGGRLSNMKNEFTGNGPFLHDDPRDRPLDIFGGKTTLHLGGGQENFVLLPIIPPRGSAPAKHRKTGRAQEAAVDRLGITLQLKIPNRARRRA